MNYKNSGVDIERGNDFVDVIKNICKHDKIGGFSGIYDHNGIKLVASTDGVGSKLELCKILNKYDTIGIDLVAMCVNDIICQGAQPLFFLDYYAVNKLDLDKGKDIISGINDGCKQSGCMLLGGETAEMPLLYRENTFDLAGFSVGVIENDIYPKNICEGDIILGLYSNGVHSNGYSLILNLLKHYSYDLEDLLKPTTIYVNTVLELINNYDCIKGFAHITGGGLLENIPRILPNDLSFMLDKKWNMEKVFHWIKQCSQCNQNEMLKTFNCNIGMIVIVSKEFDINIKKKYNMVEIGNIIKSNVPIINVDLFSN